MKSTEFAIMIIFLPEAETSLEDVVTHDFSDSDVDGLSSSDELSSEADDDIFDELTDDPDVYGLSKELFDDDEEVGCLSEDALSA